jgi:hypothetical protein
MLFWSKPRKGGTVADHEWLSSVREAVQVMTSALQDVERVLDEAMQRGQWCLPEWRPLARDARLLSQHAQRLADNIQQAAGAAGPDDRS